jgi:hypothetical protein
MADTAPPTLDVREQLARIDRELEHAAFMREQSRLAERQAVLAHIDADKRRQDIWLAPALAFFAGTTALGAAFAAGAAFWSAFGVHH